MCAHSRSSDNSVREKMYFLLTLHTVFTPEVQKEDERGQLMFPLKYSMDVN